LRGRGEGLFLSGKGGATIALQNEKREGFSRSQKGGNGRARKKGKTGAGLFRGGEERGFGKTLS